MENLKFASELPYPAVEGEENLAEAKMLMPSYAGTLSELTSILTYSFQSYISPSDGEIRRALTNVAKCEMKHHMLLGDAIFKLGGYPIMGARTYFNGSMVNYTLDPHKFLRQNVAAEEAAIVNYERTVLNLQNESVKLLLERIILDEEMHIKVFNELINML